MTFISDPSPGSSERWRTTCARRWVWLPEEAAIDLGANDSLRSLQDVTRIALEHHMIAWLSAVPAAGPVGGQAGVIAGSGCRDCRSERRQNDESTSSLLW